MSLFSTMEKVPFIKKQAIALQSKLSKKIDMRRALADAAKKQEALTNEGQSIGHKEYLILLAQAVQMQSLKSPQSAIFPAFEEFTVDSQNGVHTISGFCDAQNSYGGLMRARLEITLVEGQNGWEYRANYTASLKTICLGYIALLLFLFTCFLYTLY